MYKDLREFIALVDRLNALRRIDDPYPFFRGLLAEIGYEVARIPYKQPLRKRGVSSQNFYTLYDIAFLGIVNHSKVPLRLATMAGFAIGALSMLAALGYLLAKLLFWNSFVLGIALALLVLVAPADRFAHGAPARSRSNRRSHASCRLRASRMYGDLPMAAIRARLSNCAGGRSGRMTSANRTTRIPSVSFQSWCS